jgi:hypothetical protein
MKIRKVSGTTFWLEVGGKEKGVSLHSRDFLQVRMLLLLQLN